MKILVIDDEEMIRNLAERILKKAGFEVILAEDGKTVLDICSKNNNDIQLLLTDMTLEGSSGIDTIRKIREKLKDIPCIISSGDLYDKNGIPSDLNHNVYFLQKPYLAHQLSDLVKEILVTV